jgi:histidinol-phosphatase (PHP family)
MQPFSYHTHTTFSDGRNTAEEMIARAVELGWEEIGISDHLIVHRNIATLNNYPQYRHFMFPDFEAVWPIVQKNIAAIRRIAKKFPIKVKIGFEMDYFDYPGWESGLRKLRQQLGEQIDYFHSGNHYYITEGEQLMDITVARALIDEKSLHRLVTEHFQRIVQAIRSGAFDFIAHLDYARWGGSIGEFDFRNERREVIRALAETDTAFELSTKGLRSIDDFYPARWMLEELKAKNVPVLISDDAHHVTRLAADFAKAESLLAELNYTNRCRL